MRYLLIAFCTLLLPLHASAVTGRILSESRQLTDCTTTSPAPLNVTTICGGAGGINLLGANSISLFLKFVKSGGGSADGYICDFEYFDNVFNDWAPGSTQQAASGTVTINPLKLKSAPAATANSFYTINVNADKIRLKCTGTGGSPVAGDTFGGVIRIAITPDA